MSNDEWVSLQPRTINPKHGFGMMDHDVDVGIKLFRRPRPVILEMGA